MSLRKGADLQMTIVMVKSSRPASLTFSMEEMMEMVAIEQGLTSKDIAVSSQRYLRVNPRLPTGI